MSISDIHLRKSIRAMQIKETYDFIQKKQLINQKKRCEGSRKIAVKSPIVRDFHF